jgi:hypothetical protein
MTKVANPKKLILLDEEQEPKQKKDKKIAPEIIFVFDDLSTELRDNDISTLIKKHRHFKTKVIYSSQYVNDLTPDSRNNTDFGYYLQVIQMKNYSQYSKIVI